MKAIFLAAGQGTRLRPLTDNTPKCMVPYLNHPLLAYNLAALQASGIKDIVVVTGYRDDKINFPGIKKIKNDRFMNTNMVYSLFCAEQEFNDDLIISYSDIIYSKDIVETLMNTTGDFVVAVDQAWRELWSLRMENPLEDAETLKIQGGSIYEIGKKPLTYADIEGQFMGLLKLSKDFLPKFRQFYHDLSPTLLYDGRSLENMFMTSLIQAFIETGQNVRPALIQGGWLEIDSLEDLKVYEKQKLLAHLLPLPG